MRNLLATLALGLLALPLVGCAGGRVPAEYRPEAKLDFWSNDKWQVVLDEAVTDDGFVRWDKIKANENGVRDALFEYVGQIGQASPENRPDLFPTGRDEVAYYINAYNALAMYGVVQRDYPSNLRLGSLDPGALYQLDQFRVGGSNTTLNGLERVKIRKRTGYDPRIHFAVNCMAFSCPPLRKEPYVGDRLAEQLDEQGKIYLNDPRAAVDKGEDTVGLNAIFTAYYGSDFEGAAKERDVEDPSLLESVRYYAGPDSPVQGATDVDNIGYDWSLNAPPSGE